MELALVECFSRGSVGRADTGEPCRRGEAFRCTKRRRRGNPAASDTEEADAQAIPFAPATAADDVERAEISPGEK